MLAALLIALAPSVAPGRTEETILHDGVVRKYLLRVPKSYDGRRPTPIVFGFHGWTSNNKQFEVYTGLADAAEKRGWISVLPQGLGQTPGWNAGWINLTGVTPAPNDAGLFDAILVDLSKRARIDAKRVYVCGHSNGAFLTNLIAATYTKKVSAFGSVAGTIGMPTTTKANTIPVPTARTSGLFIHGDQDSTVAYGPDVKALLKGVYAKDSARWWAKKLGYRSAGEDVYRGRDGEIKLVTVQGGGHGWPSTATTSLLDFFQAHRRR